MWRVRGLRARAVLRRGGDGSARASQPQRVVLQRVCVDTDLGAQPCGLKVHRQRSSRQCSGKGGEA